MSAFTWGGHCAIALTFCMTSAWEGQWLAAVFCGLLFLVLFTLAYRRGHV